MMDITEVLLVWFTFFFNKKSSSLKGSDVDIKENEKLAEEFQKPVNKSFWKRKVYSLFKGNISGVDPTDMQSISKFNEEICFLLCHWHF